MMRRWDQAPRPRDQIVVFEPTLDEWIAPDHPVRLFDEVLAAQDWSAWEAHYVLVAGRPPIPPRVLASVLLYGLSRGMRSSRKLEYGCGNSLDFIWLAEGRQPDHSTLCGFRKAFAAELKGLFGDVCRVALHLGLAALNAVALDGTRVRANSSRHATATAGSLEEQLSVLGEQIERMFAEADAADAADRDLFGEEVSPNHLPRELADLRRRQERLEKALAAAKAQEAAQAAKAAKSGQKANDKPDAGDDGQRGNGRKERAPRVAVADPESTIQPDKDGGYAPNYTPMGAVEGQGGFIVDADVLPDSDEGSVTVATVDRIAQAYGEHPDQLLADAAHGSGENLAALDERGVEAYIPPPRRYDTPGNPARRDDPSEPVPSEAWDRLPRNPRTRKLDRSAFVYEAEADVYWCPLGRRLTFAGEHDKHGRPYRRYRAEVTCRGCPLHKACTRSRAARRTVYRDRYENLREAMDARLSRAEGRATYGRRAPVVETPFGHLKTQMGLRQFLLRGLQGVRCEWLWACTAYNLGKLVRALARLPGGVAGALAGWKASCGSRPRGVGYRDRALRGLVGSLLAVLRSWLRPLGVHRCPTPAAA